MKLVKYRHGSSLDAIGRLEDGRILPLKLDGVRYARLTDILNNEDPSGVAEFLTDSAASPIRVEQARLLAPIDDQEVWAAGVTYRRSKTARMEESESAASCYDLVYASPRPELFIKATPHRVSGPGESLRIRSDSEWNVPEPELTLVLNAKLELVGYTIGNDMSSREIEGDNPLYLPQAKVYRQCCGLGPCIALSSGVRTPHQLEIRLAVLRSGELIYEGTTNVSQMARSFENLIGWLRRDNTFPNGVFLMTGTGIVPDRFFTLQPKDVVEITIDQIGTLSNPVVQG